MDLGIVKMLAEKLGQLNMFQPRRSKSTTKLVPQLSFQLLFSLVSHNVSLVPFPFLFHKEKQSRDQVTMEPTTSSTVPADTKETAPPQPPPSQHELTEIERKELKEAYDEYQKENAPLLASTHR